jgi:hypothetical protein
MPEADLIYRRQEPIRYHDLYFRLLACLIGSHIIVVYGETKSTFEILLTPAYYYALAGSFLIAFILFSILRLISIRLDKSFEWEERKMERLLLQIFWGLTIPGLIAFLLAAFYFWIRGINILSTTYLRYDFQFILLQLALINSYYFASYFYMRWSHAHKKVLYFHDRLNSDSIENTNGTFQVSKGAQNIILELDDIAYFFREGETNFIRTRNGEDYFISQSLDEVQQKLPQQKFFRVNRQLIAQRSSFKGYSLLSYGKLSADLLPPYKDEVVISQKRAVSFKNWLDAQS